MVPSVADIFLTLPGTSIIAPPDLCSSGTKYLMRTSVCSWIWSAIYAQCSLIALCSCSSSSGRLSVKRAVLATASSYRWKKVQSWWRSYCSQYRSRVLLAGDDRQWQNSQCSWIGKNYERQWILRWTDDSSDNVFAGNNPQSNTRNIAAWHQPCQTL